MQEADSRVWIQTYSGCRFSPTNPSPKNIFIKDIAHSLSNQCRFTGHTRHFYSTAQHSVLVARLCPFWCKLEGLLHDAGEAYLVDLARPVKYGTALGEPFRQLERAIDEAIAERYRLTYPWPAEVKRADNTVLLAEKEQLMRPIEWDKADRTKWDMQAGFDENVNVPIVRAPWWLPVVTLGMMREFEPWSPKKAEKEFLKAYKEYRDIWTTAGLW